MSLACATCFFAERDGEPIATAALFMHEGTALLAGASTIPRRAAAGRAERAARRPITDRGIKRLRPGDDGRRARQRLAAQRRAAGIPNRLHPNQMDARRVKPVLVSIVVLLLLASTAAAQSTRVDTIAEEQAEKAKELGTEGPSDAEMIIRRVLLSPLLSGGDGLYPWFGSVYGGSGMGARRRLPEASRERVVLQPPVGHLDQQLDGRARHVRRAEVVARHAADRCHRPVARCARRVVLRPWAGLEQGRARQLRLSIPTELSGNVTLRPMRYVSLTGSYSLLADFDTHRDTPRLQRRRTRRARPGAELSRDARHARVRLAAGAGLQHARRILSRLVRAQLREQRRAPYSFNLQEYEVVQQLPLVREQFVLAGARADDAHRRRRRCTTCR